MTTNTGSAPARRLLIVGGYGVVGTAVASAMRNTDWTVLTAARRAAPTQMLAGAPAADHLRIDLLNPAEISDARSRLESVTDVVYCAYAERESMAAAVEPNASMLGNVLKGLRIAGARLQSVVLIGGGKSYAEHLGAYKSPAKESDPRFMGPIFYNDQEDILWARAQTQGYNWTVLRPDAVIGPSIGSPMNLVMGIAAFAVTSRELNVPLRFPGSLAAWSALHQATDSEILGQAVRWALTSPSARNEIFNVTNGDNFRWQHLWPDVAEFFDMPVAAPQPMSLAEQMQDKASLWERTIRKHNLKPTLWSELVSWPFLDGQLNFGTDMVQSTIKIRQAGFGACVDSHQSILSHLRRLRDYRLIP
ncbi:MULTISPECIES: SDR family oxidoreductase [Paraburkholderia]|nr:MULTISPECIES: SDR family oxidoreductase [Paraburkholderia]